jgi:hypothetical protein
LLATSIQDIQEAMAAIHFVVVQAMMMMFSPLISFYYFFDSQSDAAEEGEEKQLQEERRRHRVGGTGGANADDTVGAKGSKSKDGFEAVATEDKNEAKQAATVAVAQGAMGEDEVKTDQNLMKEQMEATQIPHQEFFKKTRRVDKLFARLYSRRKKLLSKLEDMDTNNNGFTSWDEWWYAVRTLAANQKELDANEAAGSTAASGRGSDDFSQFGIGIKLPEGRSAGGRRMSTAQKVRASMTLDLKQGDLEKLAKVHADATKKGEGDGAPVRSADDIIAGTGKKGRSSMVKTKKASAGDGGDANDKMADGEAADGNLGTITEEGDEEDEGDEKGEKKKTKSKGMDFGLFSLEAEGDDDDDDGSSSSSSSEDEDDDDEKDAEPAAVVTGRKMSVMGGLPGLRKGSVLGGGLPGLRKGSVMGGGIQLTTIPARRRESNLPGLDQLQQSGAGSKQGGRRESRLGLGLSGGAVKGAVKGAAVAGRRGRRQSRMAGASSKQSRSLSATRTKSKTFQHLGTDYMREAEALTLFEVLAAQQRAAQKEQGKEGSMSKVVGIDYRLLREELRPFVARIPVYIVRRAVFKRNAHTTLSTVLALQVHYL